jgi:hypothetical protein
MKLILIPIALTILFSSYSCKKEDIETPDKGLLKHKYWYRTSIDSIPSATYEYLYDRHKSLERINYYGRDTAL